MHGRFGGREEKGVLFYPFALGLNGHGKVKDSPRMNSINRYSRSAERNLREISDKSSPKKCCNRFLQKNLKIFFVNEEKAEGVDQISFNTHKIFFSLSIVTKYFLGKCARSHGQFSRWREKLCVPCSLSRKAPLLSICVLEFSHTSSERRKT